MDTSEKVEQFNYICEVTICGYWVLAPRRAEPVADGPIVVEEKP